MNDGVKALTDAGASLWLDALTHEHVRTGRLASLVADGVASGATTDPAALHQAITAGAYDDAIGAAVAAGGRTASDVVAALVLDDAVAAADLLRPVHDATQGADGFVTVPLGPWALGSTATMLAEAERVAAAGRPNVLVGLPATADGLAAATQLVATGIGVNLTAVFTPAGVQAAAEAYATGVDKALADGSVVAGAGVASVPLSAVDTDVDKRLWKVGTDESAALRGTAAVANARLVYAAFGAATRAPAGPGARPLRLAWALTAVRDPYYSDTHYLDRLAAGGLVVNVTEETLAALGDDEAGTSRAGGADDVESWPAAAEATVAALAAVGVSLAEATGSLEQTGLARQDAYWGLVSDAVDERIAGS